jgi:hypothetical protein
MTQAWLTLEQAQQLSQMSDSTLQRWIASQYLIDGIHYAGEGRLRRFDAEMLDLAIRFQNDPEAHEQAIAEKRKQLFKKRR